tara:strand:+ start:24987 stop:27074 length:2088 start_codon:yes stop_codon:yes gene_type:complete
LKSKVKIPENEESRLKALEHYRIIDTDAEEGFDRITRTAAAFFQTPIALVSLVDETRQWFKSRYGLEVTETPREIAFCAHTICGEETMVVTDTLHDTRFSTSKLVLSEPNIRFYAGTPLRTPSGKNLGTLCVIDTVPREFSEAEKRVLEDLSGLVIDQLELRLVNLRAEEELDRQTKNIELLRDSQTRLNAIFNSTYDAILVLDQHGQIESHNLAAEQLFGYNTSELIGLYAKTLMPDSFDTKVAKFFVDTEKTGVSKYFIGGEQESIAVRKNGERFPVELSVSEISLNSERHFCLIGRDISEKKRTEQKLIDAVAFAEKSVAAQLKLLSSLSHELLTPLNAIIGFSDILLMDIENILSTNQRGQFQQIIEGGRQLTRITKQLLEYSRRASLTQNLVLEEFSIGPVVDECWNKLKWSAEKKKIKFSIEFDSSNSIVVQSNKNSLMHVLDKLLSNAIRYNEENGKINVSITQSDEGYAGISIANTGKGISDYDLDHVFDIFSQSNSEETDADDIGLALCRAIVRGMKGEISVENKADEVSTFSIKLPLSSRALPNSSMETIAEKTENQVDTSKHVNKTILYIGDDLSLINRIEVVLNSRSDLSLILATRGPLGLALAIKNTPNLIMLDTQLAELELNDVLAKIHEHEKTRLIPILLIGSTEAEEHARLLVERNGHDYIPLTEIENSLETVIENKLG